MLKIALINLTLVLSLTAQVALNQKENGYRGLWYMNEPLAGSPYVYKYSGGLGTYPANHYPFSVYCDNVKKTYFCYGGTKAGTNTSLVHMVSFYDHQSGKVPRPTLLLDKQTNDAHDNPVMQVDSLGYIWIFSTSHGTGRPSYIHKSKRPYDIDTFILQQPTYLSGSNRLPLNNFSYLQTWYRSGQGFTCFLTSYGNGTTRPACYMTSPDGITWSKIRKIATIHEGSYQTSGMGKTKFGTAFNYHPNGLGLNYRTNLYYVELTDIDTIGASASGSRFPLPLTAVNNPALVYNYEAEGLKVYIMDLVYDSNDRPIILFLTSKGYEPGPQNGPYTWRTARWTGAGWEIRTVTTSDNNYDMGSLYLQTNGDWVIIGPTQSGPQEFNPGGEMVMWRTSNQGLSWTKEKTLTQNSPRNHTYARRPINANDQFYAFWADGNARMPSLSKLYFCDKQGNVRILPYSMTSDSAVPEIYVPPIAQAIKIEPSSLQLLKNEDAQLLPFLLYNDGSKEALDTLVWKSTNAGIATVDQKGIVITNQSIGSAIVTCSSTVYNMSTACTISVINTPSNIYFDDFENGGKLSWAPLSSSQWRIDQDGLDQSYHLTATNLVYDNIRPAQYSILQAGPFSTFTLDVTVHSPAPLSVAAPDAAILFGYVDNNNFYYLAANAKASASCIYRVVNGQRQLVDSLNSSMVTRGYDRIRVTFANGKISVFSNNSLVSITSSQVPSGKIGVGSLNDEVFFDNFKLSPTVSTNISAKRVIDKSITRLKIGPHLISLPHRSVNESTTFEFFDISGKIIGTYLKNGPLNQCILPRTAKIFLIRIKNKDFSETVVLPRLY